MGAGDSPSFCVGSLSCLRGSSAGSTEVLGDAPLFLRTALDILCPFLGRLYCLHCDDLFPEFVGVVDSDHFTFEPFGVD